MTGARLGRAILVSGARDSAAASLPRRAAAAAAVKGFKGVLLSRAPPAVASQQQQSLHALAGNSPLARAGDGRCERVPSDCLCVFFVGVGCVYLFLCAQREGGKAFLLRHDKRVIYLRPCGTGLWLAASQVSCSCTRFVRTTARHLSYQAKQCITPAARLRSLPRQYAVWTMRDVCP